MTIKPINSINNNQRKDKMALTYTQCKQLAGIGVLRDQIDALNDQPEWITCNQSLDMIDIKGIKQGGCASGAYMPAVTYDTAEQTMSDHSWDIFDYIKEHYREVPQPETVTTWNSLAAFYLSLAVELWCAQFDLDGVNWD